MAELATIAQDWASISVLGLALWMAYVETRRLWKAARR